MAPKKCPETQKSPDVAVLLRSKSRRGPQELEPEAKKLRVQGPVSSRTCESCCLLAELSSLQIPSRSSSIVRDLYQHKLGKATWSSLQQVRCFLSDVLKGHIAFQLLLFLTR